MKRDLMSLEEAQRRSESTVIDKGYSTSGQWTQKQYGEQAIDQWSIALTNSDGCRLVIWIEEDKWHGMIALKSGRVGEVPISGSWFDRENRLAIVRQKFLQPRIEELTEQVWLWSYNPIHLSGLADKALIRIAINFLRRGKVKKALAVLFGAVRGEIDSATISEALSIVQYRWCGSRDDVRMSSQIWLEVFK